MDVGEIFLFVSEAVPAAAHDITRIRQCISYITPFLTSKDVVGGDSGYEGLEESELQKSNWKIKQHATPNKELTHDQQQKNHDIEAVRRKIEKKFGEVKGRFAILHNGYRHARVYLPHITRFCFAVQNLITKYHRDPELINTKYVGIIYSFPKKEKRFKKVKI